MKRIAHGLLAVWPPLTLAALSVALIPAPEYFDTGLAGDIGLMAAAGVFFFDAGARFAEYRKARNQLLEATHSDKMLGHTFWLLATFHQGSWCRRTALSWAAANALGANGRVIVATYYKALGYKWWHITPDGAFTRKSPWLTWAYWRSWVAA